MCGEIYRILFKLHIRATSAQNSLCEVNLVATESLQVWHERLGHQNKRHVEKFLRECGISVTRDDFFCTACIEGKQQKATFKDATSNESW